MGIPSSLTFALLTCPSQSALVTGTIASAFSWNTDQDDPWSTEACWTSALVLALTAISLASQQTIGLTRLCMYENGWLKVRALLGEVGPLCPKGNLKPSYLEQRRDHAGREVKMKKSQLWMWQTPVMLSNFAILLFVVGLMISVFVRAARNGTNWTTGHNQVMRTSLYQMMLRLGAKSSQIAIFFGCASIFAGFNYFFCWICLNRGSLNSDSKVLTL